MRGVAALVSVLLAGCDVYDASLLAPTAPQQRSLLGARVEVGPDLQPDLAELRLHGADFYVLEANWPRLENQAGYLEWIQQRVTGLSQQGLAVMLLVPVVADAWRRVPDDLRDRPFDDPEVLDRFDALLDRLLTPEVVVGLSYLSLGSHIDIHFAARASEVDAYTGFVAHVAARLAGSAGSETVPTCATTTSAGLIAGADIVERLRPHCGFLPVGYYPQYPELVDLEDTGGQIDAVVAAAADLPVVLAHTGYASGVAAGGSEAQQARFLDLVLVAAAQRRDRIVATSVDAWIDPPRAECQTELEALGIDPSASTSLLDFYCTRGLLREDRTPKLARDRFIDALHVPSER